MRYSKRNAFTLIELLVAMFLFAILAAFLIPNLSKDAEKQVFTTQLGKVQNDVQQAFLMMITKNQNDLTNYCPNGNECLVEEIGEHLEYNCIFSHGIADNNETIAAKNPATQAAAYKERKPIFINKTIEANYDVNNVNTYQAIYLKNGAYVSVSYNPACDNTGNDANIGTTDNVNVCGYIEIDLNGSKKPNMVGKDIHYFWIHPTDGIVPFGEIDNFTCDENQKKANAPAESLGCTAEVLEKQKITYY